MHFAYIFFTVAKFVLIPGILYLANLMWMFGIQAKRSQANPPLIEKVWFYLVCVLCVAFISVMIAYVRADEKKIDLDTFAIVFILFGVSSANGVYRGLSRTEQLPDISKESSW